MTRSKTFLTRASLLFGIYFGLTACASAKINPCGAHPAGLQVREPFAFSDPYSQRREFQRASDAYEAAVASGEEVAVRKHAWAVCHSAAGLALFTREVDRALRPRFREVLQTVILRANDRAHGALADAPPISGESLNAALVEMFMAMPDFWQSVAASLRGWRQPGSPAHTYK